MRRFVWLLILLLCSVPFGVSISGCSKNAPAVFCNGGDSGSVTGQVAVITLQPVVYGISLNFAEIGQLNVPSATDCKGGSAFVGSYIYGTTDMTIADVQPTTGRLCAGTWNRNSGGGIPDYTYCISTGKSGVAYISASSGGVTSNPLPIFVHPVVTSIVLGAPSINCATDAATNCSPAAINTTSSAGGTAACPTSTQYPSNPLLQNGCCSIPPTTVLSSTTITQYSATSCVSQGTTAQLSARVYAGTGTNQSNISCQAGHLQFAAQTLGSTAISPVVNIDQNGVATANQPGSVLISANVSDAASSAGFFSTCPPTSIVLSAPGATATGLAGNPIPVNPNNPQPLVATAIDKNNVTLTGLNLEFESTSPTTLAGASTLTPTLAGAASITAVCQPPNCNASSFNQIGLYGNGLSITSNSLNFTVPGTNNTVLYMASKSSQYIVQRDFTQPGQGTPFLLPFIPNSMVLSTDGSTLYLGSTTTLMVVNAVNTLSLNRTDQTSPGFVLAVSPDNSLVVISDPIKQITTLESSSGGAVTTYGGYATRAAFSPDSQTVYITTQQNGLLVYSQFTGWTNINPSTPGGTQATDVAVTVPHVGAYFAGADTTFRSYCPASTPIAGQPPSESNVFYPLSYDSSSIATDRIAATNDGLHILGATAAPVPALRDFHVTIPTVPCPATGSFTNIVTSPIPLSVSATAINGVLPTPDSSAVFITYTGTGGVLPVYAPASSGPGTVTPIPLGVAGSAGAPISGVISADSTTVYVGTATDDLVHIIARCGVNNACTSNPGAWTDTGTLTPNLTNPGGGVVEVDFLAQKPRRTT